MIAADADAALAIFAAAPLGTGLILAGAPCAARDAILAAMASVHALRRLPPHVALERLTGGLDLAASLAGGRPVEAAGLLAAPPTLLSLVMAERWEAARLGPVLHALDGARCGVIALDESAGDEALAPALADRCAFRIDVAALPEDYVPALPGLSEAAEVAAAAADMAEVLCAAAQTLGVAGLRAPLQALRCARIAATQAGRKVVTGEDAGLAARLVLGPRATRMPPEEPAADQEPDSAPDHPPQDTAEPGWEGAGREGESRAMEEHVLDAVRVVLPADLLGQVARRVAAAGRRSEAGRRGEEGRAAKGPGRPAGSRPGVPGDGRRLDLSASLRAAAPWQNMRGRSAAQPRLLLMRGDLHIQRRAPRTATATIFAVDASGSQALARLAEAKGAVELLLGDCYIRRDSVALIAFRGQQAEVLLPPTRAPARARACLACLPGGGGTPLAAGLLAAAAMAAASARRGETPTIVVLTDGQANIALNGTAGRAAAQRDALAAARTILASGTHAVLIDTANRQQMLAREMAQAMGGRYVPLPRADAAAMKRAVQGQASGSRRV